MRRSLTGVVSDFDEARGLGHVEGGGVGVVPFHCVEIADGTRSIRPGAAVRFELVAGNLGRWEAAAIRPHHD